MSVWIRVPYGSKLIYPETCPFSGTENPTGAVPISNRRFQWLLPIPFIGWLSARKRSVIMFPAGSWRSKVDYVLRLASELSLIGGLVLAAAYVIIADHQGWEKSITVWIFFGGIILRWLAEICRRILLRRVRVVRVGNGGCELRFGDDAYGEKFGSMNNLVVMDKRFNGPIG